MLFISNDALNHLLRGMKPESGTIRFSVSEPPEDDFPWWMFWRKMSSSAVSVQISVVTEDGMTTIAEWPLQRIPFGSYCDVGPFFIQYGKEYGGN